MVPTHTTTGQQRTRRWRVPPPLTRGPELMEGAEILREVNGEAAVLLWKSLRSVTLWATTDPRDQGRLFAPGAGERRMAEILAIPVDDDLAEPLQTFATLLDSPLSLSREAVALACRRVAQWATKQQLTGTTLAFTQAAALVSPSDAGLAHEVGRLARAGGELARSESWHRRAIMLGRQTGAWEPYARAYVSLGNLASRRGNFPQAKRCQIKAFRAARRHALGEVMGMALHDLFLIAVDTGDAIEAQRRARQAFRAYGPTHRRIPYLAHDVAVLWNREGQFGQALPVLQAMLPRFQAPDERLLVYANIARAAGGLRDVVAFEDAWAAADNLLILPQTASRKAQALLNLARGATGLSQWERAEAAAQEALEQATYRGESQIVFQAESVLLSVQLHRIADDKAVAGSQLPEDAQMVEELLEGLACVGAGAG